MNDKNGYVRNSLVVAKDGENIFHFDDGGVTAFLDGYAVIPLDSYNSIKAANDKLTNAIENYYTDSPEFTELYNDAIELIKAK